MIRNKWMALPVLLLALATLANAGPYSITVLPTLGPNYWASPSYNAFVDNVINGILSNSASVGSGYSAYNVIGTVAPNQPIVSNFESWQGTVAPGSGEYGTELYFAVHIVADPGYLFTLADLTYNETRPDGTYSYNYAGSSFGFDRVGFAGATVYDTDQAGDDSLIPLTELIYVGEFIGYEPSVYTGNDQADLDQAASCIGCCCGQSITGQYSLAIDSAPAGSGQASVLIGGDACEVPEPGTMALAGLGALVLLAMRRRG